MKFLDRLMQGITLAPYVIQGVESIVGQGNGKTKSDKAMELFNFSANIAEAIAQKDIVDQQAFTDAARQMNDAVVRMLNASVWSKNKK